MAKMLRQIDDEALEKPFDKSQFFRLLKYMAPYKKAVIGSPCLMVLATFCGLGTPFLMSRAIGALQDKDFRHMPLYIGGMVALSIIGALSTRQRIRWMDMAGRKALAQLREDLFDHIQSLSFSFFDTRSAGKILVRVINDVNSLNDLFTNGIVNVLIDVLTLVLLFVIMMVVNWKLSLISMCIMPAMLFVTMRLRRLMRKRWQVVRVKNSSMNGYLHESLSGMRVTESFVREDENLDTFKNVNSDIRKSWMRAIQLSNAFWPALDNVGTIGTVLVYVFGVRFMQSSGLALADLLLILWYLDRFWGPLNTLSNFYNNLLTAMASMERIFEIMDTPADIEDDPSAQPLPPVQGRVTFDDVTFSYDGEKTVLKNVSFEVQPGQTIALVGPTGAGKSTVVNLVSRFYDVTGGAVKIDGHDVRDVRLRSLRQQMGVMMQDSFIFSGTIMDNIRYGRLDATDCEVIQAARRVRADELIRKMPQGYQTEIKERGGNLSQGEKQLIAFARTLLSDPAILILDEATSSIDTQTEKLLQEGIREMLRGRTSIIVAHRLSTIKNCDRILYISNKGIAEMGSHDELMAKKGLYYQLYTAQVDPSA